MVVCRRQMAVLDRAVLGLFCLENNNTSIDHFTINNDVRINNFSEMLLLLICVDYSIVVASLL